MVIMRNDIRYRDGDSRRLVWFGLDWSVWSGAAWGWCSSQSSKYAGACTEACILQTPPFEKKKSLKRGEPGV